MPQPKMFLKAIYSDVLHNNAGAVGEWLESLVGQVGLNQDGKPVGQIVDVRNWDRFPAQKGITVLAWCVIAVPDPAADLILPGR